MMRWTNQRQLWQPSLDGLLLCAFLLVLTIAGGGSRADIMGQTIVRTAAGAVLAIGALILHRKTLGTQRPVLLLLMGAIALPLIQLVPLPPAVWQALPSRVPVPGSASIWHPISLSPGGTINAALTLTVPLATALLVLHARNPDRLPGYLLMLILLSALVGALQFAGGASYNPLVNTTPGSVVGFFANRNHFALFLAVGCLIAPLWGFTSRRRWRAYAAPGVCALFLLLILSTGSRAGIVLGLGALMLGTIAAWSAISDQLRHLSKRMRFFAIAAMAGAIAAFVLSAIVVGRAESVNRALAMNVNDDQRVKALPVVLSMTEAALPLGYGFGSFDVAFRRVELASLLKPTYFNHAHNDIFEIIIEGGILALVLLILTIGWWFTATINVWRSEPSPAAILGRVGSGILLITAVASIVDYPARTPIILALVVIGALWLNAPQQLFRGPSQNLQPENGRNQ